MTCRSYKGNMVFWRRMVVSTGLQSVIWCLKGTSIVRKMAKYVGLSVCIQRNLSYLHFIMVFEVPGFNNMAWLFLFSIRVAIYLFLNKQFKEKCVYTAVHHWHE